MNKLFKDLPESVRQTLSASTPLLVVIILFVVAGKFGVSKVLDLNSQIKAAKYSTTVLTQKLSLLQTLSPILGTSTSVATSAVPINNSALMMVSQLKTLAAADAVALSSLRSATGAAAAGGLHEVNVSFTVNGSQTAVFNFLGDISKIAPISIVGKIQFSVNAGNLSTNLSVKSYWADLPKTIPLVDAPISDLTPAEKETLAEIANLTQPTFTTLAPSGATANPNPFGQ
jgi:hypothetical protein